MDRNLNYLLSNLKIKVNFLQASPLILLIAEKVRRSDTSYHAVGLKSYRKHVTKKQNKNKRIMYNSLNICSYRGFFSSVNWQGLVHLT